MIDKTLVAGGTPMDEVRAAPIVPLTRAQKVLAAVGGVLFAGLAGLGGYGSFASVRDVAEPWFGREAWIVPIGVDLGILALVSVALLLEWLAMPMPALRWMAFAFTGATVWLNVSAAHGDVTGMVMHAAMPILFITFIEAVRHAIRRRAGIAAGTVREGVPVARWLLAPFSTFRLWRRMVLWQLTSYPQALTAEQRRRHALALLGEHYGRKWKSAAPADIVWMLRDGVMLDQALTRVTDLTTPEPEQPSPPAPRRPRRTAHKRTPHQNGAGQDAAGQDAAGQNGAAADAVAQNGAAGDAAGRSGAGRNEAVQNGAGQRAAGQNGAGQDGAGPRGTTRGASPNGRGPRGVATDNEARALAVLDAEPGISGAELGRRLDISARQGQRLLSRLTRPAPAATP